MSRGANSVSLKVDTSGLKQYLDQLGKAAEEAARPAAQAMAQVYYDAARGFARGFATVSKRSHFFYGTQFKKTGVRYGPFSPGNLRDSIYQVFSQSNSGRGLATYHVSYNYKKAPYAAMVEFGTSHSAPHPFIRRAMFSHYVRKAAYEAGEKVLMDKIAEKS